MLDEMKEMVIQKRYETSHDDQPSGVIINGVELTNAELRAYDAGDYVDSDDEREEIEMEMYLEGLEEDFYIDDLGIDPVAEENYDGGFRRIVKSKREFT